MISAGAAAPTRRSSSGAARAGSAISSKHCLAAGVSGRPVAVLRREASDAGAVWRQAGADQETTIRISLEEAFRGGTKPIVLQSQVINPNGQLEVKERRYEVKIPPGILPGQRIRLTGQGEEGTGGGPSGDLYLKVEIEPHPVFKLNGRDLYMDVPVAPWEAVLGSEVRVSTLSGNVDLKIPPGTQSGQKLRLRGKGMPNPKGAPGDLYVTVVVKVPTHPSDKGAGIV